MFAALPLLALPVIVYNLIALTLAGASGPWTHARLTDTLFTIHMTSRAEWAVSLGDLLLAASLVVLFVELLKSTTSRKIAIINHSLSMVLFIGVPGRVPARPGLRDLDLLPDHPDGAAGRAGRLHRHHRRGAARRGLRRPLGAITSGRSLGRRFPALGDPAPLGGADATPMGHIGLGERPCEGGDQDRDH
jgi:hypothetical protein